MSSIYVQHKDLPEIEESALDTADVGLYLVKGKSQRGDMYRPQTDDWVRDVEQIMIARIDEGRKELPGGVYRATLRTDGKRMIADWVLAEPLAP